MSAAAAAAEPLALPQFLQDRIRIWDEIAAENAVNLPQASAETKITVTLPNGGTFEGVAGVTTPMTISQSIKAKCVVAKVNGQTWDLNRPLEGDCKIEFCDFNHKDGQYAFWHSSAHVLGQAIELIYPEAQLCVGPPIDDGGFYYDVHMSDRVVVPEDYPKLEQIIDKVVNDKQPFQRLALSKDQALRLFKYNPFKVELISNKVPDGATCTAYRCGPLIDLCRGPHVPNTSYIKAMAVLKHSSSYWLGKAENASLQRIYGISFPDKKQLKEYKFMLEQAEARDHRKLGTQQNLFFFHTLSPGSCFFMPHGARVYNKLVEFIRGEYWKRGYSEVISPNMYSTNLWKQSGHYEHYKENMFCFEVEKQEFAMKPMNCPGHCIMFGHTTHSYRELPIRFADFGVLHRNEFSGALTGLTRVRRFQQDDAHIFCRSDQIRAEVSGVLDMLKHVYGIFGFQFELQLSTRPEKYLGAIEVWDEAECALAECLDLFGQPWTINARDGAFYGPKIDIKLTDALRRKHQCATIQLDFQLPIRFNLSYKDEQGKLVRPVIIHRAILGSVERMFAVLIEHTGGQWPFWLSPRQAIVIPLHEKCFDESRALQARLHKLGYYCDVDDTSDQFKKKIRDAVFAKYNYILALGPKDMANDPPTVGVRVRGSDDTKIMPIEDVVTLFAKKLATFEE